MKINVTAAGLCAFCACAGMVSVASADVYSDPGVFAPFGNAQVDFVWEGSSAGYTGQLQWVDSTFAAAPVSLWTNKSASAGQTYRVPRLYGLGERVDYRYEITKGHLDAFASAEVDDWSQFSVDASNPFDVVVRIEDIRLPRGDGDYNDAVFRIVFSEGSVPTPGALALLGLGGVAMMRRRR